jgi:hypothetical protein
LLESAPVDSLYGIKEYHYSSVTGQETSGGIQYYVDLDAPEDASRYYRWVLEETWEEHSEDEIWGVYDGLNINLFYPRDSLYTCWKTKDVTGLYSVSTILLSENRIKKIPLHFVESTSPKLDIKYCATIKQYALNADAYDYWYQKEKELNESGNIYTSQPNQPKSNIHNTNNPDEQVEGFFWVASCSIKHAFVKKPFSGPPNFEKSCAYVVCFIESTNYTEIVTIIKQNISTFADIIPDPPVYISLRQNTQYLVVLTPQCVDCRLLGGVALPDFWE